MVLIAGPCVIESRELVFAVAEKLRKFNEMSEIDFYFKSSFDRQIARAFRAFVVRD